MSAIASVRFRSAFAPHYETMIRLMSPANRAHSRYEADPIRRQDKNENGREEPERPLHQVRANDGFQKAVQALHEPFQQILRPAGHAFHIPRRAPGEDDQADGHDPTDDHRIGDEAAPPLELDGRLRQTVLSLCRKR
jgi:hypothetical protein